MDLPVAPLVFAQSCYKKLGNRVFFSPRFPWIKEGEIAQLGLRRGKAYSTGKDKSHFNMTFFLSGCTFRMVGAEHRPRLHPGLDLPDG